MKHCHTQVSSQNMKYIDPHFRYNFYSPCLSWFSSCSADYQDSDSSFPAVFTRSLQSLIGIFKSKVQWGNIEPNSSSVLLVMRVNVAIFTSEFLSPSHTCLTYWRYTPMRDSLIKLYVVFWTVKPLLLYHRLNWVPLSWIVYHSPNSILECDYNRK